MSTRRKADQRSCRVAPRGLVGCAAALALWGCSPDAADSQGRIPTPELTAFEAIDVPGVLALATRAPLGGTGSFVGLALQCWPDGSQPPQVHVYFGAFPSDRRPVQLAVRTNDGREAHFGQAVRGGPDSGFHSPTLSALGDAEHFLQLALRPGSLVSNGHNAFWNRIGEGDNEAALDAFLSCARGAA